MGPISKTGGAGWVGVGSQENRMGVPSNFKNTLALLTSCHQSAIKKNTEELRRNLVTNFGNEIQITRNLIYR
jgi:hypothetical protein